MIDTHAHLDEIAEIDRVIRSAAEAGLKAVVAVGMDLASNRKTLELAKRYPGVIHPAIGYHPWSIRNESIEENLRFIEANLGACVALGEVGLDYKVRVRKKVQWQVFSRLLEIAANHRRPVIVHSRYSHQRAHLMVREAGIEKAVFHWYTGSLQILEDIIADGFYVSATPALAYSPPHQAAIKAAPLERILVETDSPVEYQGRASEPADLSVTLREISRLKGMAIEETRRLTTGNARAFFGI